MAAVANGASTQLTGGVSTGNPVRGFADRADAACDTATPLYGGRLTALRRPRKRCGGAERDLKRQSRVLGRAILTQRRGAADKEITKAGLGLSCRGLCRLFGWERRSPECGCGSPGFAQRGATEIAVEEDHRAAGGTTPTFFVPVSATDAARCKAVEDSGPFGRVRRPLDGNPVQALRCRGGAACRKATPRTRADRRASRSRCAARRRGRPAADRRVPADTAASRAVVARVHPRRWVRPSAAPAISTGPISASISGSGITPGRSSSGASDEREHRRFDAHARRAAIQHAIRERFRHVLGGGRRKLGEAIGAGRGDRDAGGADQLQRQRMRGHAQADGRQSGGDDVGDRRLLRHAPASADRASSARASGLGGLRPFARQSRAPSRSNPRGRSADWCAAGPSLRKCAPRRRRPAHWRRGRKPSRSGRRPACRRGSARAARSTLTPGSLVFAVARDLAGLAPHQVGVDQRLEIAFEHAVHVADAPACCAGP